MMWLDLAYVLTALLIIYFINVYVQMRKYWHKLYFEKKEGKSMFLEPGNYSPNFAKQLKWKFVPTMRIIKTQ